MRTVPPVPALVTCVLAALAVAPAAAHADVVQSGNTFTVSSSTQTPEENGADLASAVSQAKAIGTAQNPAVVDLDYTPATSTTAHSYVVPGTITLTAADHVTIQSAAEELTASDPGYDSAFDMAPEIRLAGAGTVLDLSGAGSTVRGVTISDDASLNTMSSDPLVKLGDGATLGVRDLANPKNVTSIAQNSDTARSIPPLLVTGTGSTVAGVSIYNDSVASASITINGSTTISGGRVVGGDPGIDVNTATATSTQSSTIDGIKAYAFGSNLIRVIGGGGTSSLQIRNSHLIGAAANTALVNVRGAAVPGSLAVGISTSTLEANDPTTPTTGIAIRPGTENTATTVSLSGVLAATPSALLACSGQGAPTKVTIADSYWNGTTTPGSACDLSDPTNRVTGDIDLDDSTGGPRWDSVLVDKVATTAGSTYDYSGNPRTSLGPTTPAGTPVDIGADEYQYQAPVIVSSGSTPSGTTGTVSFSAATTDNDDTFDADMNRIPSSTLKWTFPDGSTKTGASVSYTFPATGSRTVTVTATDPTGLSTTAVVVAAPDFSGVPTPTPTPVPTPTPTPTPTATPTPTPDAGAGTQPTPTPTPSPAATNTPAPTNAPAGTVPTPTPAPTTSTSGAVVAKFQLVSSRISTSAKKASGLGKAASNEAALLMTLNRDATITLVARTQKGTKYGAISGARVSVSAKAGVVNLRLSSVIGKAKLKAGLYRITLLVAPTVGTALPTDRQDFSLRIK